MRPIAGTVTDPRALQRVERLLAARDPHPSTPPVAAANAKYLAAALDQVEQFKRSQPDLLRLELAQSLARVAHHGQLRKDGEPYTTHLERVAGRLPTTRLRTVAWLHDVLEDTRVTEEALASLFPADIVFDVRALTRGTVDAEPGDMGQRPETYAEFIQRTIAFGSDGALQVKLADLADNLSTLDAAGLSSLRARYMRADVSIRNEIKRRIEHYARRNAA